MNVSVFVDANRDIEVHKPFLLHLNYTKINCLSDCGKATAV